MTTSIVATPTWWRGFAAAAVVLVGGPAQGETPCPIRLVDVSARAGVAFRHTNGDSGRGYIVEGVSAGLALFDYDGDGWIDILFLNGAPLGSDGTRLPTARNALYRNLGNWTFRDVTTEAGLGESGFGLGVAVADYDNDGDLDVYLNDFGSGVLYGNNGDQTFSNVTRQAGLLRSDKVGAGASFLDRDGDGHLDLYVAQYVDFNFRNHVPIVNKGHHFKAGPQYYRPEPDLLFHNEGNGTFRDVSRAAGITAVAGPGMGIVSADFDDDGDTDIFVCNDGQPNFLFENDGRGRFQESALLRGVAYDGNGKANSNMGVDVADYDDDGRLDLFTTAFQSEMPVLYRNLGGGQFADHTHFARLPRELFAHVHWGTAFADFDLDGDRDLLIACGHFDRIELIDDRTALKVRNFLLMNIGDGKFVDVSDRCGDGLAVVESSRGVAVDDLDNDGDLDVVVLNSNAPPTILRNDSQVDGHWLELKVRGPRGNCCGVGARVQVVCGGATRIAEVINGRGYQSHFGTRLHFGLGACREAATVHVRWPTGARRSWQGLGTDRCHTLEFPDQSSPELGEP